MSGLSTLSGKRFLHNHQQITKILQFGGHDISIFENIDSREYRTAKILIIGTFVITNERVGGCRAKMKIALRQFTSRKTLFLVILMIASTILLTLATVHSQL